MRAFVTGGTGFIGSTLVEALLQKGYDVSCLVRSVSNVRWLKGLPVRLVEGDLSAIQAGLGKADALAGAPPVVAPLRSTVEEADFIFHVAGITKATSLAEYRRSNALAAKNIVEAAALYAPKLKRFVHMSSLSVCGPAPLEKPADENSPCRPLSSYGISKYEGEQAVVAYRGKIPITLIRPPVVYGPRDTGVYLFFKVAVRGICPSLGVRRFFSLIQVRDLVRGIILAAEHPAAENQIYFLSNAAPYSFDELVETMTRALGENDPIHLHIPEGLISAAAVTVETAFRLFGKPTFFNREKALEARQSHWVCSSEKARRELGFEARISLDEGIRETAAWYRKEGWL